MARLHLHPEQVNTSYGYTWQDNIYTLGIEYGGLLNFKADKTVSYQIVVGGPGLGGDKLRNVLLNTIACVDLELEHWLSYPICTCMCVCIV